MDLRDFQRAGKSVEKKLLERADIGSDDFEKEITVAADMITFEHLGELSNMFSKRVHVLNPVFPE